MVTVRIDETCKIYQHGMTNSALTRKDTYVPGVFKAQLTTTKKMQSHFSTKFIVYWEISIEHFSNVRIYA